MLMSVRRLSRNGADTPNPIFCLARVLSSVADFSTGRSAKEGLFFGFVEFGDRIQMRRYLSAPVVRIRPERSSHLHVMKTDDDMLLANKKEILKVLADIKEILRHSLVFL